jgi:hypothetical protein
MLNLLKTFVYKWLKTTVILLGSVVLLLSLNRQVFAATGTNKQISFQGKVVNTNGTNVVTGLYDFEFNLYTVDSGGAAVWTETRTGGNQVQVTDGVFQVNLGSVTTLPGSIDFNTNNIYLSVKFSNEVSEMLPRIQFTAVPQALNALKVAGLTVTDTTGTLTIPSGKTISFADAFTTSGAFGLTLTTTALTNVTLPTTGILSTLAGSEILTNKTIGSTGLVISGAATDIDTAAAEGLTLQGRASSSFNTTSGNISFQVAGTSTTANFQIGAGGAGSTTPDFFGLDVKSNTGDPAGGFNGAMYYNTADKKFRCFQDTAWMDCVASPETKSASNTTSTAITTTEASVVSVTFTPASTSKYISVWASITFNSTSANNNNVTARIRRTSCTTGPQIGVDATGFSINATEYINLTPIGLENPATTSTVTYHLCVIGTISGGNAIGQNILVMETKLGADLAEFYNTDDTSIVSGDVVSIDPTLYAGVQKTKGKYDKNSIGIITTNPSIVIGAGKMMGANSVAVALAGRVPVKVTAENGAILPGNYLTSSSIPGVAMKATKAGAIIGQAMESYTGDGIGKILVFVQTSFFTGEKLSNLPGLSESSNSSQDILNALVIAKGQGVVGGNISEVFTDRLVAAKEVITPQIITDILYAKKIKADSIEGLEILTDKISSLQGQVAGLSAPSDASVSAETRLPDGQVATTPTASAVKNIEFGSARFTMDVSVLGKLNANSSLIVAGPSQFQGESIFEKLVSFMSDVIFKSKVSFEETPVFNKDAAGLAVIEKDANAVEVTFEKEYEATPVVSASFAFEEFKKEDGTADDQSMRQKKLFEQGYTFMVVNRTKKGFTVVLNKKATEDIAFSWVALAIKDAKTSVGKNPVPTETPTLTPLPTQPTVEQSSTPEPIATSSAL